MSGVLVSQVMQNDAFVQYKGVEQGMFYDADDYSLRILITALAKSPVCHGASW